MNKNKNEEIKKRRDTTPAIIIVRYTYQSWMKCYPNSNENEWTYYTQPMSFLNFVTGRIVEMNEKNNELYDDVTVKVVTLDEEYFEWLGQRKNVPQTRAEYANRISDKEAVRLARQNKLNYTYNVCLFPIVLTPQELHVNECRKLTRETQLEFELYIKQITKKLDIYVFPYLVNMNEAKKIEVEYKLAKMAEFYFETGETVAQEILKTGLCDKDAQLPLYGVPIVFRETHDDTMTIRLDNIINDDNVLTRGLDAIVMDDEFFKLVGIKGVTPLLKTRLLQNIKRDLKLLPINDIFVNFFVGTWEIEEYCHDFAKEMMRLFGKIH